MSKGTEPLLLVRAGANGYAWLLDPRDKRETAPPDRGCDLVQYDARCGRCSGCPMPMCILDLDRGEQRRFRLALRRLTAVPLN